MIRLIPPYFLEFLLFAVLVALAALIASAIRRRWKVAPVAVAALLPDLTTDVRVRATIRRVFRDPDQGVFLVEASVGKRKLTFCAVDYESQASRYTDSVGKEVEFALYALGVLEAGGAEALRARITDLDKVGGPLTNVRCLAPAGGLPHDYVTIGKIISLREAILNDAPVHVYRIETDLQTPIDLAVEPSAEPPFTVGSLVHGSARLFGYLAD